MSRLATFLVKTIVSSLVNVQEHNFQAVFRAFILILLQLPKIAILANLTLILPIPIYIGEGRKSIE